MYIFIIGPYKYYWDLELASLDTQDTSTNIGWHYMTVKNDLEKYWFLVIFHANFALFKMMKIPAFNVIRNNNSTCKDSIIWIF